jgi:hypothetical protein
MPIPSMEPLMALFRVAWELLGPCPIEGPLGSEAYPAAGMGWGNREEEGEVKEDRVRVMEE